MLSAAGEMDAVGANAGSFKPFTWTVPDKQGLPVLYPGMAEMLTNPGGACVLDGMPIPCETYNNLMNAGGIQVQQMFRTPEPKKPSKLTPPGGGGPSGDQAPAGWVWATKTSDIAGFGVGLFGVDLQVGWRLDGGVNSEGYVAQFDSLLFAMVRGGGSQNTGPQNPGNHEFAHSVVRCPPTADELLKNPKVQATLKEALKRGLELNVEHGRWIFWKRTTGGVSALIKQPTIDPLNASGEADDWDRVYLNNPPTPPQGWVIVGTFHVHLEPVGPSGDFDNWAADQFKTPGIHIDSSGRMSTYGNYERGIWNTDLQPPCR